MYVTPDSLKDYFYIATKAMDASMANQLVGEFLRLFHILTVDENTCRVAHRSTEVDFEDALVQAAAELNHMDFIVTRDRKAFQTSLVRSVDPNMMMRIADSRGRENADG